jgi:transcriptional regulator NrdR family protein
MKRFLCPICHNESRIYAKDKRYIKSANCILRYRRCVECDNRFMTKEDLDEKTEQLFRTITKKPKDLLEV